MSLISILILYLKYYHNSLSHFYEFRKEYYDLGGLQDPRVSIILNFKRFNKRKYCHSYFIV